MTNLNYGQARKQIEKRRRSRFFFRLPFRVLAREKARPL